MAVQIWETIEACRDGEMGREERVWTFCGEVEEGVWRQVFVRWICRSRDEEGGR